MKNKLLLLTLQVILVGSQFACHPTEKQEGLALTEPSTPSVPAVSKEENKEYLDGMNVRINGKFPLVTSVQNINNLLGKPDSVVAIDWDGCTFDFRSKDSKLAYYGEYVFEQFGDSLDFVDVTFSTDKEVFLLIDDLRLDASTTLEEIKRRYPESAKDPNPVTMTDFGQVEQISLAASKELTEGGWSLIFKNGKLVMVEDWFPC